MISDEIIRDVQSEYSRQMRLHGGVYHDEVHTISEWMSFREEYETRIKHILNNKTPSSTSKRNEQVRENLIKIATLALAEVNTMDLVNLTRTGLN